MLSFVCKIFQFILGVVSILVDTAAEAIKVIGNALWDVLESVVTGVSSALGLSSFPLLLIGGGLLFFLITRKKDDAPAPADSPINGGGYASTVPG